MRTLSSILFCFLVAYVFCETEITAGEPEGENFTYHFDWFDGGDNAIGLKRELYSDYDNFQFFYFCEKTKGENKKKCGAWVDEKGTIIKSVNNKLAYKGKEAVLSKVVKNDAGNYYSLFEDPKKESTRLPFRVSERNPSWPKP
ncbi:hypothetical protein CAEBREN_02502 [Caenorhabditis brenneri]|uniref:Uncharacterized protein n=1 Tax=Caenorhabditis brenneri TaxID=135651 RepID=G0NLQ6_CAEBE|nr:hypothetical protein CAEBREN_02502 [Caenorhabditis brenneri]